MRQVLLDVALDQIFETRRFTALFAIAKRVGTRTEPPVWLNMAEGGVIRAITAMP